MTTADKQDSTTQHHGPSSRAIPPLLLASDGSEGAVHATDAAVELARALGAHVIVAAVATGHRSPLVPWDTAMEERPIPTAAAAEWAHTDAQWLRTRGVHVTEIVLEGHPADALLAEAAMCSAGVIIVGRHGASHEASPLPGSLVEELARRSLIPVLIVP